jgi:hypothetical protein
MKEEYKLMKYLKIDDNRGFYLRPNDGKTWVEIDKINKDDLLALLDKAIAGDFEMDPYSESTLGNKAHQIIYKNITEKLQSLIGSKDSFKDESDGLYRDAIAKYR